jgi:putative flippase GtrA
MNGTRAPAVVKTATVDVVVPVCNKERALRGWVEVLESYLDGQFPFQWKITIVDNASSDNTLTIANDLAERSERVHVLHLDRKGWGWALREAWQRSVADVVAYMDVALSTGLDALLPLVAPLINGHSDVSIGSRLAPDARTVRGPERELISGCYAMIRLSHGVRFSDARCGFKADIIRPLLERVKNDNWFFDTELLLLAERHGVRVHEVPQDWVEDVDTRVHLMVTAIEDIRGLIRVARAKAVGTASVTELPKRPEPSPAHPDAIVSRRDTGLPWQLLSFAAIGVLSTVVTLLLYALFRPAMNPLLANLFALVFTTILNTEANRRFTFLGARGSSGRVHMQAFIVFGPYYAFTSIALIALHAAVAEPTRFLELVVLLSVSVLGTAGRFVLLSTWFFKSGKGNA